MEDRDGYHRKIKQQTAKCVGTPKFKPQLIALGFFICASFSSVTFGAGTRPRCSEAVSRSYPRCFLLQYVPVAICSCCNMFLLQYVPVAICSCCNMFLLLQHVPVVATCSCCCNMFLLQYGIVPLQLSFSSPCLCSHKWQQPSSNVLRPKR
jgi:hypothetical protein